MSDQDRRKPLEEETLDGDALDDDALERVTGGAGSVAHELTHTVQQQDSSVGANQTNSIGANQSLSVDTTEKR